MTKRAVYMLILSGLLLSACSSSDTLDTTVDCDMVAYTSVNATIVDSSGSPWPIEGTYLWYSVDGGEEVPAENYTGTWSAGVEVAGAFTLRAGVDYWVHEEDCTGYWYGESTEEVTVGMTEDGCHVEPIIIDIVVTPDCIVSTLAS
jgi:hypothetical protein